MEGNQHGRKTRTSLNSGGFEYKNLNGKQHSNGNKNGAPKQGMEYRPKVQPMEKNSQIVVQQFNNEHDLSERCKEQGQSERRASGSNSKVGPEGCGERIGKLEHRVEGKGSKVLEPIASISDKHSTLSTSSLDASKHTVMFLQQSRQTLEELKSVKNESKKAAQKEVIAKGGSSMGKENIVARDLQKRQVAQGVKLQSTGDRNHGCQSIVRRFGGFGSDWRVAITHIYREGNRCADFLATYALDLDRGFHSLEEPPEAMRGILHTDARGVGSVRLCLAVSD
ncbi:hypothetical protein K1719_026044 [Acacia pycnantha]|nr:hypothetical protein K1719_026044 [Acacia pycnantha]